MESDKGGRSNSNQWSEDGGNSKNSDAFNQDDYLLEDNIDLDEDQNQSVSSDDEDFEDDNVGYEKEELLIGIKKFFNPFIEKNPEAKADIENFLHEIKNWTLEEIENAIVSFKEASLKWQAEQNSLDVFSSCSMEALKEEMDLEGIDDEVSNHEILA